MSLSLVQQAQGTSTSAVASKGVAFSGNTTTGNMIVVTHGTVTNGANAVTGVTDSQGNTYVNAIVNVASASRVEIWYAKNITGGTTPTVTMSFGGAGSRTNMTIHEVSGQNTTAPLDITSPLNGSGTPATVGPSSATTQNDEIVFSMVCVNASSGTITAGSGYSNLIQQVNSTVGLSGVESKIISATGAQSDSMSYTGGGGSWRTALATFKAAAAATYALPFQNRASRSTLITR